MSRFLEFRSVLRDLRKHVFRAGKVTAATLHHRTSNDLVSEVAYKYAYKYPITSSSGVQGGGPPVLSTTIVLWQVGETTAPAEDDRIEIGSETWEVMSVNTRLNGDTNFAVHDCTVFKPSV